MKKILSISLVALLFASIGFAGNITMKGGMDVFYKIVGLTNAGVGLTGGAVSGDKALGHEGWNLGGYMNVDATWGDVSTSLQYRLTEGTAPGLTVHDYSAKWKIMGDMLYLAAGQNVDDGGATIKVGGTVSPISWWSGIRAGSDTMADGAKSPKLMANVDINVAPIDVFGEVALQNTMTAASPFTSALLQVTVGASVDYTLEGLMQIKASAELKEYGITFCTNASVGAEFKKIYLAAGIYMDKTIVPTMKLFVDYNGGGKPDDWRDKLYLNMGTNTNLFKYNKIQAGVKYYGEGVEPFATYIMSWDSAVNPTNSQNSITVGADIHPSADAGANFTITPMFTYWINNLGLTDYEFKSNGVPNANAGWALAVDISASMPDLVIDPANYTPAAKAE